jgi:hypothetical protein
MPLKPHKGLLGEGVLEAGLDWHRLLHPRQGDPHARCQQGLQAAVDYYYTGAVPSCSRGGWSEHSSCSTAPASPDPRSTPGSSRRYRASQAPGGRRSRTGAHLCHKLVALHRVHLVDLAPPPQLVLLIILDRVGPSAAGSQTSLKMMSRRRIP